MFRILCQLTWPKGREQLAAMPPDIHDLLIICLHTEVFIGDSLHLQLERSSLCNFCTAIMRLIGNLDLVIAGTRRARKGSPVL